MRSVFIATVLATLAVPAMAQQGQNNGLNGVMRNLEGVINPNARQDTRRYDEGDTSGRMRFRSQEDVRAEQRRLDEAQHRIDEAQRQVNQQRRDFDRAREDYEANR